MSTMCAKEIKIGMVYVLIASDQEVGLGKVILSIKKQHYIAFFQHKLNLNRLKDMIIHNDNGCYGCYYYSISSRSSSFRKKHRCKIYGKAFGSTEELITLGAWYGKSSQVSH